MGMGVQSLVVWLVIGLIAGWLASQLVGGRGGLVYYLIIGLIGSFIGGFIVNFFHIHIGIGSPIITEILVSAGGAIVLVLVARAIR
ncbi:MAG: GlsB/YeaQ/YmgE family stress response membrane protein [Ancalomicrobiaceae bacterium]|nr:GlsB/YeaQ/YmgE family stress response membrane protein [Ancalomicrobiaceae bacterium]